MKRLLRGGATVVVSILVSASTALTGSSSAAPAPACGSTLNSWTSGASGVTVYSGVLSTGGGDNLLHTVALANGKAVDTQALDNRVYDTYKGDYSSSSIKDARRLLLTVKSSNDGDLRALEFFQAECDPSGNVTRARLSFADGGHMGYVNRTA